MTEEFLYLVLWAADSLSRPSWCNLFDTFDSWTYRNRLSRRIAELERLKLIERKPDPDLRRFCRLTEEGRRLALGGRVPLERWSRRWDGQWRFVVFDLPVRATRLRSELRRFVIARGFGHLQQSVWITPDSLADVQKLFNATPAAPDSLVLFEGHPCGGESNEDVVKSAWDYEAINALYDHHHRVVVACPGMPLRGTAPSPAFLAWAKAERESWNRAACLDPFLPRQLLPGSYLGIRSWQDRISLARRGIS